MLFVNRFRQYRERKRNERDQALEANRQKALQGQAQDQKRKALDHQRHLELLQEQARERQQQEESEHRRHLEFPRAEQNPKWKGGMALLGIGGLRGGFFGAENAPTTSPPPSFSNSLERVFPAKPPPLENP